MDIFENQNNVPVPIILKNKIHIIQSILVLLPLFLVAAIFYLSWLPNGHLGKETYLPLWLLNWSNIYFNLRTAIPFTAFSFLLETRQSLANCPLKTKIKIPFWIMNLSISAILVCLAEGGQFFISKRHPDFMDVFFGILGSILGCFFYYLFNNLFQLVFIKKEKQT